MHIQVLTWIVFREALQGFKKKKNNTASVCVEWFQPQSTKTPQRNNFSKTSKLKNKTKKHTHTQHYQTREHIRWPVKFTPVALLDFNLKLHFDMKNSCFGITADAYSPNALVVNNSSLTQQPLAVTFHFF